MSNRAMVFRWLTPVEVAKIATDAERSGQLIFFPSYFPVKIRIDS